MSVPTAGQKRIVIVGATGMVGGYALCYALNHPSVDGADQMTWARQWWMSPSREKGSGEAWCSRTATFEQWPGRFIQRVILRTVGSLKSCP
jgi:hypothetical protein